ncbi:hypothetical protein [Nocardia jiangxiensis]|uniref:hypothetical protein n=1 Tax=Nocardia jiangxiensis TaxID=282685 RepID=UPI0002E8E46C|nr:hypothetical protein [Nocardia jiangxiensis]
MAGDGIKWNMTAKVIKYEPETVERLTNQFGHEPTGYHLRHLESIGLLVPDDIVDVPGNLLTTVGLNRITNLIIGGGGTPLAHADAVVGVGNSTTTAVIGDTALGADGTANAYYQQADSGSPTQSNGTINITCTYQSGNANFAWQEWGWAVASGTITAGTTLASVGTSPVLLNHKIQSLGTKSSGAIWSLAATLTLS